MPWDKSQLRRRFAGKLKMKGPRSAVLALIAPSNIGLSHSASLTDDHSVGIHLQDLRTRGSRVIISREARSLQLNVGNNNNDFYLFTSITIV
ncbi:hypothetical protein ACO22_03016 [Paracoccidioides brasiliensis]|uniref:Uncharacterized protein n=1 Tax=Paracoccidioides brasiliensis TaxID=121759 RepID=A0A1D2JH30_PARBR|nr:hypothetical protein ACO22_03016 [Paracoccidioides brasiliensis]ODH53017.1 hypothetical protein GX48_00886 [Paracoccidioides brasiliensis]